MTSTTSTAPPSFSTSAHAAAVEPVVSTSSTSSTRAGTDPPWRRKVRRRAARRSAPVLRACDDASRSRTRRRAAGRSSRVASARASISAWSKPLRARRLRDSGTQVTISAARPFASSAIAAPRCGASACVPANFIALIAFATGPPYRNAARARSTIAGGQSAHPSTECSEGRPHRSHHGGVITPTSRVQPRQSGQPPGASHAAQRGGNSRSERDTARP